MIKAFVTQFFPLFFGSDLLWLLHWSQMFKSVMPPQVGRFLYISFLKEGLVWTRSTLYYSTETAMDYSKWFLLKIIPGQSVQQRPNHIDYSRTCSVCNGCQERRRLCFWARTKDEHISLKKGLQCWNMSVYCLFFLWIVCSFIFSWCWTDPSLSPSSRGRHL